MIIGPLTVFLHLYELGVLVWPYPTVAAPPARCPTDASEALAYAVTGVRARRS